MHFIVILTKYLIGFVIKSVLGYSDIFIETERSSIQLF